MDRTSSSRSSREIMNNQQSCMSKYLCIPLYTFCVNCCNNFYDICSVDGPIGQPIETQIPHESTLPNERRESTLPN